MDRKEENNNEEDENDEEEDDEEEDDEEEDDEEDEEDDDDLLGWLVASRHRRRFIFSPGLEKNSLGIPCPDENTLPVIEAKAIVLRCVVCGENQIQTVNFPCMHACFCLNCASASLKHSKNCPHCRETYMHISMLYLSYEDAYEDDISDHVKKRKKVD